MSQPTNLYGIHVATILLENHAENIIAIYLQDSFIKINNPKINQIVNLANQYGIKIQYFPKQKLDQFALSQQHQGVVVQCKGNTVLKAKNDDQLKAYYEELLEQNAAHKFFMLILDGIQDPHNLGACIRSAAAMGIDCVILPQNNSVGITSTVCKTSAGTALTLPIFQVVNLARIIEWLKKSGVWVYGAQMRTDTVLSGIDFTGSSAIVMGAEGSGMRQLTTALCDQLFSIPMASEIESLNVSVATGICLYEVARQRG